MDLLLLLALGYILPAYFIVRDGRVKLLERAFWLLATFLISWFAFLIFLWLAPLFGAVPDDEVEDQPAYEKSRKVLGAAAGVGSAISLVGGVALLGIAYAMIEDNHAMVFIGGILAFIGLALLVPGDAQPSLS